MIRFFFVALFMGAFSATFASAATLSFSNIQLEFTGASGGSTSLPVGPASTRTANFSLDPMAAPDNSAIISAPATFNYDTTGTAIQSGLFSVQVANPAPVPSGFDMILDFTLSADVTIFDATNTEAFGQRSWDFELKLKSLVGGAVVFSALPLDNDFFSPTILSGSAFSAAFFLRVVGNSTAPSGATSSQRQASVQVRSFETITAVPIPASGVLMLLGACALGGLRRRRGVKA